MRAFGVCTIAVTFFLAGCGKTGSSWVDTQGTKPPSGWIVSAELTAVGNAAEHRRTPATGLRQWRAGLAEAGPVHPARSAGASDEIARRIGDDLTEWEDSRAETASSPQAHTSNAGPTTAPQPTASDAGSGQSDLPYVLAARRKHSTEYLNARLRIAVLEARVSSADESERKVVTARLERANADLKAIDALCREEASISKANSQRLQNPTAENGTGPEAEVVPAAR